MRFMIDIIIPVYNARKTLPRTLMSIALQEISTDILVTIVDDYSSEDYQDIIVHFQKFFPIQYHRLDENIGSGLARNKGLDLTNQEFLVFIDADDLFYDVDSLEALYQTIHNSPYDIVSGAERDEARSLVFINEGDLHGKIYRRSYIEENKIRFNHTRFHEDNYFNSWVLLSGANNYKLMKLVYIYCFNESSITKQKKDLNFQRLTILLSNVRDLLQMIPLTKENKELISHFVFIKYKYYNRIYREEFTDEQKKTFCDWIQIYDPENIDLMGIENVELLEQKVIDKYNKKMHD